MDINAGLPEIFPDYIGVTIPAEIAPMNFNLADDEDLDAMYVRVTGSQGGEITAKGKWADFDIKPWHALLQENVGGSLSFDVYAKWKNGQWTRFAPFEMQVSQHPLADYGVTYRRIAPGFETFSKIGIYQRQLSTYDESPILEETAVNGQCMNCHYANRGNPDQFSLHIRGKNGGTIMHNQQGTQYLNTKTPETAGNCTYGYWHPDGRYCAYSLNRIYQNFYTGKDRVVEPWDQFADIIVLDTHNNQIITTPLLATENYETTPAFSADGTTIYFSYAPHANMPADFENVKYSLCSIGFDADRGLFGEKIDTIVDAAAIGKSVSIARPSYDGKYLMYCLSDYGTTPVDRQEAELWIMDIATGQQRCMDEVNTEEADAYHNWSSNSRWFLFNSKRHDRITALLYLSAIGDNGVATKPFLLPQKNPKKYYTENRHSFNAPDFTTRKVDLDPIAVHDMVMSQPTTPVSVKK